MPRGGSKLPALTSTADGRATLALAVTRLRTTAVWSADANEAELCEHKPPFGLLDGLGRIQGILWNAPNSTLPRGGRVASASANGSTSPAIMSSSSGSGGGSGSSGAAAPLQKADAEAAYAACIQLAHVLKTMTGRPQRPVHGSCAVVGSSGGLTGSGQGARIDSHDAVYRFNTAPVGGPYLADVGNRTSVWVASHIPWRSQARRLAQFRGPSGGIDGDEVAALYCFNPWLGSCHVDAMGNSKRAVAHGGRLPVLISPMVVRVLMQIQAAAGGKSGGALRPSTGLIGVGLALASCARVSLFGFGNDSDTRMQGHCNHYYDCRTNQTNYFAGRMGYHDWHGQWRALAALINLGAIEYVAPTGAPNTFLKAKPTKPAGGGRGAARRGEVKVKPQIRNGGNRTHGGGHGIASRGASPRDHKASTGKMARSGAGLKQLASSE